MTTAQADPLPGQVTKFLQAPMVNTPIVDINGVTNTYGGHDELSTAYGFLGPNGVSDYSGRFMADDFADNLSSPIVHIRWWGSYHNATAAAPPVPVQRFLIAFESDLPASANPAGFSRPDQVLSAQVVKLNPAGNPLSPTSGTFAEKLIRGPDPVVNEALYEYNAELNLGQAFAELKDTVYWLKIVALVDVPPSIPTFPTNNPPPTVTQWGWHNRDYTIQNTLASPNVAPGEQIVGSIGANTPVWHFQDDAVTGDVRVLPGPVPGGFNNPIVFQPAQNMTPTNYMDLADGPAGIPGTTIPGISSFSKDLAFEIFTVPEPATCALTVLGIAAFAIRRRPNG